MYRLRLDAWVAACRACAAAGARWPRHLAAVLEGHEVRRVPFRWDVDDGLSVALSALDAHGGSSNAVTIVHARRLRRDMPPLAAGAVAADVQERWSVRGPEDALLKHLPVPGGVARGPRGDAGSRDPTPPPAEAPYAADRALYPIAAGPVDWAAELAEAEAWVASNARALPVRPGYLYLAAPAPGTARGGRVAGPLKLGFSREPERRVARLREKYELTTPYVLLRTVRGEPHEERALHARLRRHRAFQAGPGATRPRGGARRTGLTDWYRASADVLGCFDTLLPELRAVGAPRRVRESLYPVARLLSGFVAPGLPTRWLRYTRDPLSRTRR